MERKKKQLTQAQIDYRNSILRSKVQAVKKADEPVKQVLSDDDKIRQCFYYLNNCVFWVNEYIGGNSDKLQLLKTAQAMQVNAQVLELLFGCIIFFEAAEHVFCIYKL